MQRTEVVRQLKQYFIHQVLDGQGNGLDETTPLLEWGLINSIEIVRLVSFIHQHFSIEIPVYQMVAGNFMHIDAIADMILKSQAAQAH